MNIPDDRLARELRADAEAVRLEAHAAKMDLLRLRARYDHLHELAPLWPVLATVVEALPAVESAP